MIREMTLFRFLKAIWITAIPVLFSFTVAAQEGVHGRDSVSQKSPHKFANIIIPAKQATTPADSLPGMVAGQKGKIDSLQRISSSPSDSLLDLLSTASGKLSSLQNNSSAKIDSLRRRVRAPVLKMPGDSLTQKSSVGIAGATERIGHAEDRLQAGADSLENKVTVAGNKVQQSVEDKVQKISGEKIDLPDQKLPGAPGVPATGYISVSSVYNAVPSVEGLKLPDVSVPAGTVTNPVDAKIDQRSVNVPDIFEKVKMPDELDGMQQEADKVGESLKEAEQFTDEAANLKEEGLQDAERLPEAAEKKVIDLAEVKGVKKNMGIVTAKQQEYEAMIARYKDKKLVQSEIKRKMTNVVNDKLNQLSPEVKEAQASFGKSKKLYSEAHSLSGAKKKRKANAMAGKSFEQRLVPGLTFQAYNRSVYSVDWGLQLGYRLTGRFTVGIGGTYRTGFSKSYESFVKSLDVYGGRIYADFLVRKGFFLHGEFEILNTGNFVPVSSEVPDADVLASNVGIGKRFKLTKRINGNILALYRLEFDGHLPDQSKINLRMGFDLKPGKKGR